MSVNTVEHKFSVKRERLLLLSKWGSALCIAIYSAFVVGSFDHPWMIWPALGFVGLMVVFLFGWLVFLDEAAQQAHYIAWYWGGSIGLVISALTFVALTPQLFSPTGVEMLRAPFGAMNDTSFAFTAGFMLAVMPACIGYMVWWAGLWLRRR
ncbi:MAG: hypothetical protein WDM79_08365 [Terricaulis sp.]